MEKTKAIAILKKTKQLSTDLLPALGITFECWLRFAALPKERADRMVMDLIDLLEKG